jgi:hypothetical protein
MTLAAAAGHSMETLLDSVGTLSTMLHEVTGLFQNAVISAASPSLPGEDGRELSASAPKTPQCDVQSMTTHAATQVPGSGPTRLPACLSWVDNTTGGGGMESGGVGEGGRSAQLVLIKQVVNGRVTFFTNRAFETYVISRDFLQSSWASKGRPSTELFLHPDDAPLVCAHVGRLWKGLVEQPITTAPTSGGGPEMLLSEKTCLRDLPTPVRVWVSWPHGGYVYCAVRVHLVVTKSSDGQTSHIVFSFRPAQGQPQHHTGTGLALPQPPGHTQLEAYGQPPQQQGQQLFQQQQQQFSTGSGNPMMLTGPSSGAMPPAPLFPTTSGGPALSTPWSGSSGAPDSASFPLSTSTNDPHRPVNPGTAAPPPSTDLFVNATEEFWDSVASITTDTGASPRDDLYSFAFHKI